MAEGNYLSEFIEVDEYTDGSIIGDFAMLNNTVMDHSILSIIPSELFYISLHDIDEQISKEDLETYRR